MSTPATQKRNRRLWRERRRAAGMSWFCVGLNHPLCSGYTGRLVQVGVLRDSCTCPCHEDEEYQQMLEDAE